MSGLITSCSEIKEKPTQTFVQEDQEKEPLPHIPDLEITAEPETKPEPPAIPQITVAKVVTPAGSLYPIRDYGSPYLPDGSLSNKKLSWYFNRNAEHIPPTAMADFDLRMFDGYYLGDVSQRVVYLTFDQGYEFGCTETILDILLEKGVKAAFFTTEHYVTSCPDLIKRMLDEGHIVANHSSKHKSSPDLTDEEFRAELLSLEETFMEQTGMEIAKYFRPPSGEYSARTLNLARELGYKSVFWSSAHRDWETDNQPGMDAVYEIIMSDLHNGAVYLLHGVSWSNTEALPYVIDSMRESGYAFATLDDFPEYILEETNN